MGDRKAYGERTHFELPGCVVFGTQHEALCEFLRAHLLVDLCPRVSGIAVTLTDKEGKTCVWD